MDFLRTIQAGIDLGTSDKSESNRKAKERIVNKVKRLSFYLLMSAIGIFIYLLEVPFMAFSGSLLTGMWQPYGWCLVWGLMTPVRFLPSFCQVQMARDKKSKTN